MIVFIKKSKLVNINKHDYAKRRKKAERPGMADNVIGADIKHMVP
jgi:hypothetical protein